jgi:hypothetical protein
VSHRAAALARKQNLFGLICPACQPNTPISGHSPDQWPVAIRSTSWRTLGMNPLE